MFTGLVQAVGSVLQVNSLGADGLRFVVGLEGLHAPTSLQIGASIALNGACHTIESLVESEATFYSSPETLAVTNLGEIKQGDMLNLERSLCLGQELGGHLVSGHIDGLAVLENVETLGDSYRLSFTLAKSRDLRYLVLKGSVSLDGVSLTVASLDQSGFSVVIIPHTWDFTNLASREVGAKLNLEFDMLAKYVERLLAFQLNDN